MKIKLALALLVFLICNISLAQTNIGKELNIRVDQGHINFGSQYAYDTDTEWIVTYVTTISNSELQALPKIMQWNVYDMKSKAYLSEWQNVEADGLLIDSLGVGDPKVIPTILANLRTLALVFATVDKTHVVPLYFLDTGKLCQSMPERYFNLTLGTNGCDLK